MRLKKKNNKKTIEHYQIQKAMFLVMRFAARNSRSDQFAADFLRLKHVTLVKIALISFFSTQGQKKTLCSVFLFFFVQPLFFCLPLCLAAKKNGGHFGKKTFILVKGGWWGKLITAHWFCWHDPAHLSRCCVQTAGKRKSMSGKT